MDIFVFVCLALTRELTLLVAIKITFLMIARHLSESAKSAWLSVSLKLNLKLLLNIDRYIDQL